MAWLALGARSRGYLRGGIGGGDSEEFVRRLRRPRLAGWIEESGAPFGPPCDLMRFGGGERAIFHGAAFFVASTPLASSCGWAPIPFLLLLLFPEGGKSGSTYLGGNPSQLGQEGG